MLGSLGEIIFEASDSQILSFNDLSFNRSANYTEHKILGRNSLLEFTGLNASTCTIKLIFDDALGIDPQIQIKLLVQMFDEHQAVSFVLDGQPVGAGLWVIESINETDEHIDRYGRAKRITATVNLKEYVNSEGS